LILVPTAPGLPVKGLYVIVDCPWEGIAIRRLVASIAKTSGGARDAFFIVASDM
jgi:hypothetical protein